jgi:hypothetical protein
VTDDDQDDGALSGKGGVQAFPRLLRPVSGDFTVSVRVGGYPMRDRKVQRGCTGLLLTDGETFVSFTRGSRMVRFVQPVNPGGGRMRLMSVLRQQCVFFTMWGKEVFTSGSAAGVPLGDPAHLRITSLSGRLTLEYGTDGEHWEEAWSFAQSVDFEGSRLKVGVIAANTSGEDFSPWFDELRLDR